MTIFDDIRKDREAGTDGPWSKAMRKHYWDTTYGWPIGPEGNRVALAAYSEYNEQESEADARRIARVPQLEDLVLAGVGLAKIVLAERQMIFDSYVNISGRHKGKVTDFDTLEQLEELDSALAAWEQAVNEDGDDRG